jgi:hypothetical protein
MLGGFVGAVGRGLVAGAIGTAAMTVSSTLEMRLRGRPPSLTPARAAEAVFDLQPLEDDDAEEAFSESVHWLYGTAWGVPRAFIDAVGLRGRDADLLHFGAFWGTALWMLPSLRVAPPPEEWGNTEILIDALHHLIYVLGAGAAYDALKHV